MDRAIDHIPKKKVVSYLLLCLCFREKGGANGHRWAYHNGEGLWGTISIFHTYCLLFSVFVFVIVSVFVFLFVILL